MESSEPQMLPPKLTWESHLVRHKKGQLYWEGQWEARACSALPVVPSELRGLMQTACPRHPFPTQSQLIIGKSSVPFRTREWVMSKCPSLQKVLNSGISDGIGAELV